MKIHLEHLIHKLTRRITGNFMFAFLLLLGLVIIPYQIFRDTKHKGPLSPHGHQVIIDVSDRGIGWGRDYYTNISIVDSNGKSLAYWEDPDGQQSSAESNSVIKSIRWINDTTVQFNTAMRNEVTLSVEK